MAHNRFGTRFTFTTWGESHGPSIGVVIDGCPAGIAITTSEINLALKKRAPGQHKHTSPRKEADQARILSGVYQGKTTGAPISLVIENTDVKSEAYVPLKDIYRPGHANYTYLQKYGRMDQRGGGRASARETAARVAAGAVAQALLNHHGISIQTYMHQIGTVRCTPHHFSAISEAHAPLNLSDEALTARMWNEVNEAQQAGDAIGGVVGGIIQHVPCGLGEPIYEKIEAKLACAMMSIPASKGFEVGMGFDAAAMRGSEHNDSMQAKNGRSRFSSNHAGGILGGISTGEPITFRVAFKPTSSIKRPQSSTNTSNENVTYTLDERSRHDPCVAIRAIPVVEAMTQCVIADCLLLNQTAMLNPVDPDAS